MAFSHIQLNGQTLSEGGGGGQRLAISIVCVLTEQGRSITVIYILGLQAIPQCLQLPAPLPQPVVRLLKPVPNIILLIYMHGLFILPLSDWQMSDHTT